MKLKSNIKEWNLPKHSYSRLYNERMELFIINGRAPGVIKKHDLAESGLFYEGRSDLTIGYFCGGGKSHDIYP